MNMLEDEVLAEIMRFVAVNPKASLYRIGKGTNIGRITVMRKIKEQYNLVETGILEMEKGKRNAEKYSFTLSGLIFYLMNESTFWQIIGKIIENHSHMLLTFKKWHLFQKAGLEDSMFMVLESGIKSAVAAEFGWLIMGYKMMYKKENIDKTLLMSPLFTKKIPNEIRKRFCEVCKKDKELKAFIEDSLIEYEKRYRRILTIKDQWQKI